MPRSAGSWSAETGHEKDAEDERTVSTTEAGEVFWLFRDKLHYIGVAESREDRVHVFWGWNKWKRRRWYKTMPDWDLEMAWEYMRKTSKKV